MRLCATFRLVRLPPAPEPKAHCSKFGFGKVPGGGYEPERSRGESLCFFYLVAAVGFSPQPCRRLTKFGECCAIDMPKIVSSARRRAASTTSQAVRTKDSSKNRRVWAVQSYFGPRPLRSGSLTATDLAAIVVNLDPAWGRSSSRM